MVSRAPVNTSLVKYNTAVLVSTASKGNFKTGRKAKLPPPIVDKSAQTQTEEILNLILPPKETSEDGQLWVQYVSPDPATPADVKKLQEELDKRLVLRGAKEVGICPEREELFSQAFDEIIRQVTIICTDRGKVLVRVRNEANMTIKAYQTLCIPHRYESSVAFGMRKSLQAAMRNEEMTEKAKKLEKECEVLQNEVTALEESIAELEARENARIEREEKEHRTNVNLRRDANMKYRAQLEQLLSNTH